jgi:hypothetical protein
MSGSASHVVQYKPPQLLCNLRRSAVSLLPHYVASSIVLSDSSDNTYLRLTKQGSR